MCAVLTYFLPGRWSHRGKVAGPSPEVASVDVTGRGGRGREWEADVDGGCPPFLPGKLPSLAVAMRPSDQPAHRSKWCECEWHHFGDAAGGSCPLGDYPGRTKNLVDSVVSQGGSHH